MNAGSLIPPEFSDLPQLSGVFYSIILSIRTSSAGRLMHSCFESL